jgi:hypothetical protein
MLYNRKLEEGQTRAGSAMMGKSRSLDDRLYVQQMSRAVAGSLAALIAYLISGDDDDDMISFTGPDTNPAKAYKLKVYGTPVVDYRMAPNLYMPIRMAQAYNEFHRKPENKDAHWSEGLALAYWSGISSIKDMSFLDGLADFVESVGSLARSVEDSGESEAKAGKYADALGRVLKKHLEFALKPIPSSQAIVKNFEKVVSPERESRIGAAEDVMQMLGLQAFYNNKYVDITGNHIKALPGDDILPLSEWFGYNKTGKDIVKAMTQSGVSTKPPRNAVRTFLKEGKTEVSDLGTDVEARKMNSDEYYMAATLAGQKFTEFMNAYMSDEGDDKDRKYSEDKDKVMLQTTGESETRAKKVIEGFKGNAWAAAVKELYGEVTLTQDELNELQE